MIPLETVLVTGVLFGAGTYLVLQRSRVRMLFGFLLLTNAANLAVLCLSGAPDGKQVPIISDATTAPVDPLPQALILTAIVIGFGVTAYLVALLYRLFRDESENPEEQP